MGGVSAFVVMIAIAVLVPGMPGSRSFGPEEAAADGVGLGVAVLPFSVNGADMEVWREGMVDVLAGNIDGSGGLRSIDPRTVMARWRRAVGDGEAPELGAMLEVARSTGARYAVVGSATRFGEEVRLNTQIYDLVGEGDVGSASVQGPNSDVLSLVDRLSVQTAAAAVASGGGTLEGLRHTTSLSTSSPEALRYYLEGEALYRGADFAGAADAFRRATAIDSTFALASVRLSRSLGWLRSIGDAEGREMLEAARRFSDRLPPRERELVELEALLEYGDQESVAAGRSGTQSYPDDPEFWEAYGEALYHAGAESGHSAEEALAAFSRTLDLDPSFGPVYIHPIELTAMLRDSAETYALLEQWEPRAEPAEYAQRRAYSDLQFGDAGARAAAIQSLSQASDRDLMTGYAYSFSRSRRGVEGDLAMADEFRRRGIEPLASLLRHASALNAGNFEVARGVALGTAFSGAGGSSIPLAASVVAGASLGQNEWDAVPNPSECDALFCWYLGVTAATEGDRPRYDAYLQAHRARVADVQALDDPPGWVSDEATWSAVLEALGGWHFGDLGAAEAYRRLRVVHGLAAQPSYASTQRHLTSRWWMAEALLSEGRHDDARRYYDSLWDGVTGAFFTIKDVGLADAYRGMGEEARARELYETFLSNWSAAPADNVLVLRARAGLEALGS
jgi:tetratricopeptide (TPR) repeat protein